LKYLNNHLIKYYNWKEKWKAHLKSFEFGSESPKNFTFIEDSIFNSLCGLISKKIDINSTEGGIVVAEVLFENDTLARLINNNWVNEMILFFKNKSNSSLHKDIEFQTKAIDSLQNIIFGQEVKLTQLRDENNAIVKAKAYLEEIRVKRQIEINTVLLREMIKNHEMSKYTYMTQKAIVEIIESPRLPLTKQLYSIPKLLIIGVSLGGFLSFIFYVFIPAIKEEIF
jgi:hypothetical protein